MMIQPYPWHLEEEHYARMQWEYEHEGEGEEYTESDLFSVDEEEAEQIEAMTGFPVEELGEPDLQEVISEFTGIDPDTAWFDGRLNAIIYTHTVIQGA